MLARRAVAFPPVDTRNEADRLCACRLRRLDRTGDGCAPILIPVVEGIDLAQSDETQAALARHLARAHRLDPVKDWSAEIVSRLHADTAKLGGEVEKGREAKFRHRLLVQCEVHGGFPCLGCVAQASRFMIHSTSGAGRKRHFRRGPAMTFR